MHSQSHREEALDPNFIETIGLLNGHEVPYWVCHGTLLGLVRDGCLIPWDHDIDIGVWADSVTKTSTIELMTSHGFELKSDGADYDFLQFTKDGGREVDFNFYHISKSSDTAYSEWFIARSKLTSVLDELAGADSYVRRKGALARRLKFLAPLFRQIVNMLKAADLFYRSAGYTTPVELLDAFEFIEVAGLKVRVPHAHEGVLEYVYGPEWRTPKKQFEWQTESPSTRISNSRFK